MTIKALTPKLVVSDAEHDDTERGPGSTGNDGGLVMTGQLTPYLCVDGAAAALDWYQQALGARLIGEPIVMDDGAIGHAELSLGGARLYLADPAPEIGAAPPAVLDPPGAAPVALHLEVADCAAALDHARAAGAHITREPEQNPYGTGATFLDPFGHRWFLMEPA